MSPGDSKTRSARRAGKKGGSFLLLRSAVLYGLALFVATVAGILVFNLVIMPAFVRHGDEVSVPELTGKDIPAAERLLARAGLSLGDTRPRHDSRPAGTIIAQLPTAGTTVKNGRSVICMTSIGLPGRRVPAMEGQSLRNAEVTLGSAGLTPGEIIRIQSDIISRDAVIASEPPGGSAAATGTVVNLLVSTGPRSRDYLMPDLRGLDASAVERRLKDAGFSVTLQERGGVYRGRRQVQDHTPAPGSRVVPGSMITLFTE